MDEVRHVQYGLVLALVSLVLLLNLTAIVLRARVARRMRA
jgi:phosphate transport system permease protein